MADRSNLFDVPTSSEKQSGLLKPTPDLVSITLGFIWYFYTALIIDLSTNVKFRRLKRCEIIEAADIGGSTFPLN